MADKSKSRLEQLEAKLAARENTPGYEKNCEALRAEITKLKAAAGGPEFNL